MLKYKIAKTDTGFWKNTNNFFVAENFFLYTEGKKKTTTPAILKCFEDPKKDFWLRLVHNAAALSRDASAEEEGTAHVCSNQPLKGSAYSGVSRKKWWTPAT